MAGMCFCEDHEKQVEVRGFQGYHRPALKIFNELFCGWNWNSHPGIFVFHEEVSVGALETCLLFFLFFISRLMELPTLMNLWHASDPISPLQCAEHVGSKSSKTLGLFDWM